jgi:hypothetical protein
MHWKQANNIDFRSLLNVGMSKENDRIRIWFTEGSSFGLVFSNCFYIWIRDDEDEFVVLVWAAGRGPKSFYSNSSSLHNYLIQTYLIITKNFDDSRFLIFQHPKYTFNECKCNVKIVIKVRTSFFFFLRLFYFIHNFIIFLVVP